MKKKLIITSVLLALVAITTIGTKMTNNYKISSVGLMLANMEALASTSEGGDGEFKCYIYKDQCIVRANTEAQLNVLNNILKKLGMSTVGLKAEVNITDATCLYSTTPNGPIVRCGTDKRCADIWSF